MHKTKTIKSNIFDSCTEMITITDKNIDVVSIGSTDSSSDEENFKKDNPTKRVTRRGLGLVNLCSSKPLCEIKCSTSAIYSSKILDFREQTRNVECLNSINPSELLNNNEEDDDDNNISVSRETRQINKRLQKKENINRMNSEDSLITAISNKRSKSPSPPPVHRPVVKKMPKKTRKLLGNIEKTKLLYDASKLLYTCESPVLSEKEFVESNSTRVVFAKFRWQDSIFRIPIKRNEKFLSILPEIAEKCQSKQSDILIARNEETIQIEESPNSIDLSSADILDCYILTSASNIKDQHSITLFVQASDCKTKVSISVNKLSPLSELMEEYARQRNIPVSNMKFKFDGDILEPADTPVELDMQNENCIDVVVSN